VPVAGRDRSNRPACQVDNGDLAEIRHIDKDLRPVLGDLKTFRMPGQTDIGDFRSAYRVDGRQPPLAS
jgi:hypothetical protein